MPKNLSLFGQYLRNESKRIQGKFKMTQITRLVPVKAWGYEPSASSQMTLWGADDFNRYNRKLPKGVTEFKDNKRAIHPLVFKKDFQSNALNTTIFNLRVSSSALYSMDDAGGFDNYILRTPPEELRSATGEKMREVMYFYMQRPDVRDWGLPWKIFLRAKNRKDPEYARYAHEAKKEASGRYVARQHAKFSPYYLPTQANLHPARQEFIEGSVQPELNLWWREGPALEAAFRRRLSEAKSFERAHADHREPMGFRYGETMGGGGKNNHCSPPRKRSRALLSHFRHTRPY